jgi:spore germination cell wall hydrolase CwlJ-like protein
MTAGLNTQLYSMVMSLMISSVGPSGHECLAQNIYFEARNQSHIGMLAVGHVTLNRVEDSRYPDNICGVVKQQRFHDSPGAPIQIGNCQFSWYCDGKSDTPRDQLAWEIAKRKAAHVYYLDHLGYDMTEGSTHYHATDASPNWVSSLTRIVQIDDHIFYRWE